eukprot:PhF_6_TR3685/c0_g1_i1/m.5237
MQQRREIKVTFIGNGGVGKTSILQRHPSVTHTDSLRVQNFSLDLRTAEITSRIDGSIMNLSFWDTGPAESMQEFLPFYVAHSDVVVVVYSITNRLSFEASRGMMRMVYDELGKDACIMLVGNKVDLGTQRAVMKEEGMKLATHFSAKFEETSAIDNTNVSQAFRNIEEYMANAAGGVAPPTRKTVEASMWSPSPMLYPVAVPTSVHHPLITTKGEGIFHLLLLGDNRVGKTTFIRTFTRQSQMDRDDGANAETICVQQHTRNVGGLTVYLWDTPGSVELRSLCVPAVMEASGVLVFHELTMPLSLKSALEWIHRVKSLRPEVPMYLVSNTKVPVSPDNITPVDSPCTQCICNAMKVGDVDRTIAHLVHDSLGFLIQDLL